MCRFEQTVACYACGHVRCRAFVPSTLRPGKTPPPSPRSPAFRSSIAASAPPAGALVPCKWAEHHRAAVERWFAGGQVGPCPPHPCHDNGGTTIVDKEDKRWSVALSKQSKKPVFMFGSIRASPPGSSTSSASGEEESECGDVDDEVNNELEMCPACEEKALTAGMRAMVDADMARDWKSLEKRIGARLHRV